MFWSTHPPYTGTGGGWRTTQAPLEVFLPKACVPEGMIIVHVSPVVTARRESYQSLLKHGVNKTLYSRLRNSYCYYPRGKVEAASEPRWSHGSTHCSATKMTSSLNFLSSKACGWISNHTLGSGDLQCPELVQSRNPSSQNYFPSGRAYHFTGKPCSEGRVLPGGHFLLLSTGSLGLGAIPRLATVMVISYPNITQTVCCAQW